MSQIIPDSLDGYPAVIKAGSHSVSVIMGPEEVFFLLFMLLL